VETKVPAESGVGV